jgi:Macrocin-O-methyltransferase (TylF)
MSSTTDGRYNYDYDNDIESSLINHFEQFNVTLLDLIKTFPIYARRVHLKRFLAHYQLFLKVLELPGDIVELGVFRGSSLMSWANFLEIHCMGDRHRKVIGFDNFAGFQKLDIKDGREDQSVGKVAGGFDSADTELMLRNAIAIFDSDRFIPFKPRVVIVKGNIEATVPDYVCNHPGLRISLLHFDVDLYIPTLLSLQNLWPLVVPGGVVLFDEYAIPPWEGESKAVDEFFAENSIELKRFTWSSNPGAYAVKR